MEEYSEWSATLEATTTGAAAGETMFPWGALVQHSASDNSVVIRTTRGFNNPDPAATGAWDGIYWYRAGSLAELSSPEKIAAADLVEQNMGDPAAPNYLEFQIGALQPGTTYYVRARAYRAVV